MVWVKQHTNRESMTREEFEEWFNREYEHLVKHTYCLAKRRCGAKRTMAHAAVMERSIRFIRPDFLARIIGAPPRFCKPAEGERSGRLLEAYFVSVAVNRACQYAKRSAIQEERMSVDDEYDVSKLPARSSRFLSRTQTEECLPFVRGCVAGLKVESHELIRRRFCPEFEGSLATLNSQERARISEIRQHLYECLQQHGIEASDLVRLYPTIQQIICRHGQEATPLGVA
jgi:hypothetical protein